MIRKPLSLRLLKSSYSRILVAVVLCLSIAGCDFSRTYVERGTKKIEDGDHEAAITEFTKAVFLNPLNGHAFWLRGMAKTNLAIDQLPEVIPSVPYPIMDKGLFRSATSDFDQALRLNPDAVFALLYRAMASTYVGDHEAAVADVDQYLAAIADVARSIRDKPDEGYPFIWRGRANLGLERFPAAISDFDQHIRKSETPPSVAYVMRSSAKFSLGQAEQAFRDIEIAIDLDPDDPFAYEERAFFHYSLGNYVEAIQDADVAIRLFPEHPYAYYLRGKARTELNQNKDALVDMETALGLTNGWFSREFVEKIENRIEALRGIDPNR